MENQKKDKKEHEKKDSRRSSTRVGTSLVKSIRKSIGMNEKTMSSDNLLSEQPRKSTLSTSETNKSMTNIVDNSSDSNNNNTNNEVHKTQSLPDTNKSSPSSPLSIQSSQPKPRGVAERTVSGDKKIDVDGWKPLESFATAIHSFEPSGKFQIPIRVGDKLSIQEETKDWYKGLVQSSGKIGIFPKSYVRLSSKLYDDPDPVMEELSEALWEWTCLLKSFFKENKMKEFENMKQRLKPMLESYTKIRSANTEESLKIQLKNRVIDKIEEGRRLMGLDVIIRQKDGSRCTEKNTSIIELLNKHISITERDELVKKEEKDKKGKRRDESASCLILLDLKVFACSVGEPTEVFCSLWRSDTNAFVSEDFLVTLTPQGMPVEVDRIGFIKAVFKDVLTKDVKSGNLYLFLRLVRKGKLEKKGKIDYRIPFGGCLGHLKDLTEKETEFSLPVYTTTEANFWNLPELILKQKEVTIVQKAKGVFVGLTLLQGLYNEHKESLYKVTSTEKYGFPDVILPGASRNDFYLTIESADFNLDKTIEVVISVKMENGEILPDCLRMGTSEAMVTTFHSMILYHNNNPRWNEKISLLIPPGVYEKCFVYFEIRTASSTSSKEIGFGFLPLNKDDGTVIDDGHHEIKLYKKPKHDDHPQGLAYLSDTSKFILRKEALHVNTLLCSTALTQYSYIRSLLKWKQQQSNLPEILNRLTFGSQFEIIKFFQEIFDAMFQIIDAQIEGIDSLVYDAIVFVIVILVDEKTSQFTNFRPVLDMYINKLFQSTTAYQTLLRCWQQYLDSVDQKPNISTLKAMTCLLKIIKKSCYLKNGSNYNISNDSFLKSSLNNIFTSFNEMMTKTSPALIGAQSLALKNLTSLFEQLYDVFKPSELALFAQKFISSIPRDNMKVKIRIGKLGILISLLKSDIFNDRNSRNNILVPLVFDHLRLHFTQYAEVTDLVHCFEIISILLDYHFGHKESHHHLIPHLIQLLPFISQNLVILKDEKIFLTSITCYLNIYFIIDEKMYGSLLKLLTVEERINFLAKQNELAYWFCAGKTFPKNWFSLKIFQLSVVKKIMFFVSAQLQLLRDSNDSTNLWLSFFQSAFAFLDSEPLKLESFSSSKKAIILENYGDMRITICNLIKKLWSDIDTHSLIRGLTKEFLKIAMIDQRELKELGVKLYYSALEREFKAVNSFKAIEGQTIEVFSVSIGSNANNLNYFFSTLESYLQTSKVSNNFIESSKKYLCDMKELCQHLIALNKSAGGNNDDDRTIATLSLMEYLKESNRITTYIRYVNSLVEQHSRSESYLKAALISMLHSNLLSWKLNSKPDFQKENEFEKKLQLYEQAIDFFDRSEAWELAINLLAELYQQYQSVLFDYVKSAECLEKQATMLRKMMNQERLVSEYFRVGFYGKYFPSNIRGKEFIYCGLKLERIGEFTERILNKYTNATLLKSTEPPTDDVRNGDDMLIQIFTVKPEADDQNDMSKLHPNLPSRLRDYRIAMCNVNKFLYKRPFSKDKALKKENEFKDLWIMNYYYKTKESFPLITDRAEIIEVTEVEVTPLQNAIITVQSKNEELHKLSEQYKDSKNANISPFTMVLSGTVDAAVSGGLDNYKHAFLSDEFIENNRSQIPEIEQLKQLFQNHLTLLSKCIVIHRDICPESLIQLQVHLEEKLEKLKETWNHPDSATSESTHKNNNNNNNADSPPSQGSPKLVSQPSQTTSLSTKLVSASSSPPVLLQSSPRGLSPRDVSPREKITSKLSDLDQNWGGQKLSSPISANSTAQKLKSRRTLIGSRRDDNE